MTRKSNKRGSSSVAIIGAGLAGSEAALVLADLGIEVVLYEMRPERMTPAHTSGMPAELVCSNSLKSEMLNTAHGILKAELSLLKSPIIAVAKEARIPAGSALAVDRDRFSRSVNKKILEHPKITLEIGEVTEPPSAHPFCIIAAGPLASDRLATWLSKNFSSESMNYYDAIAPIISADSINMSKAFYASRWGKGGADYCNCPFTEEEYRVFYDALISADRAKKHDFEDENFFEACLPIEVLAQRGYDALVFGALRPVGLTDPNTGKRSFAVCQLRKENAAGESLGMVGFQTRMTIREQKRVLRRIPGLENAEFLRYGSIHRNTYLNSPSLLSGDLSFKNKSTIFLAGQICGSEGYTESIATGNMAAIFAWARISGHTLSPLPITTACGALLNHVTNSREKKFTPSNINFGLFAPISTSGKKRLTKAKKRERLCERALEDMQMWINKNLNI